jgi:hypothetical protein
LSQPHFYINIFFHLLRGLPSCFLTQIKTIVNPTTYSKYICWK